MILICVFTATKKILNLRRTERKKKLPAKDTADTYHTDDSLGVGDKAAQIGQLGILLRALGN
jgi:hypothetical protein